MSWKPVSQRPEASGYFWLYDRMFDEVVLSYEDLEEWDYLDGDYTEWMYDGESAEPPLPPQ